MLIDTFDRAKNVFYKTHIFTLALYKIFLEKTTKLETEPDQDTKKSFIFTVFLPLSQLVMTILNSNIILDKFYITLQIRFTKLYAI